jgi:hypothetical protein
MLSHFTKNGVRFENPDMLPGEVYLKQHTTIVQSMIGKNGQKKESKIDQRIEIGVS